MRESTYRADSRFWHKTASGAFVRVLLAVFASISLLTATAGEWAPLANDGVHDPRSPAVKLLQQPQEALSVLVPDNAGNQVRWVESLDQGQIKPRERINPKMPIRKRDTDVILDVKGGMPAVRFPHRQHTEWLDCDNCHTGLFEEQAGATKITMFNILQGEQCGVCHGAVSFPLTECKRCHSIPKAGAVQPAIPPGFDPATHQRQRALP